MITRVIEGKDDMSYIGSAANIRKRFNQHRSDLGNGNHTNRYLQNSWNKYGEDAFVFDVLEIVNNKANLLEREQSYLDTFQTFAPNDGFNIMHVAGSNLGYKMDDEAKKRHKEGIARHLHGNSSGFKGKSHSDEAKKIMSEKRKGKQKGEDNPFYGKSHKTEDKLKKSKFSVDDILDIRLRAKNGESNNSIAKIYNTSGTTISLIVRRITWNDIK